MPLCLGAALKLRLLDGRQFVFARLARHRLLLCWADGINRPGRDRSEVAGVARRGEAGRIRAGIAAIVSWLLRLIDTIDVPRRGQRLGALVGVGYGWSAL